MRYIEFGKNKAQVSEIVLGSMRIPAMSAAEVGELIETCLDEGINMIDTADIYGGGHSEELIGEALAAKPGLRDEVFLQTKCSIRCLTCPNGCRTRLPRCTMARSSSRALRCACSIRGSRRRSQKARSQRSASMHTIRL